MSRKNPAELPGLLNSHYIGPALSSTVVELVHPENFKLSCCSKEDCPIKCNWSLSFNILYIPHYHKTFKLCKKQDFTSSLLITNEIKNINDIGYNLFN